MGTSTAYEGPKGFTPLIPSWLNDGDMDSAETEVPASSSPPERSPIPPVGDPKRFKPARSNFSRYVSSGGADRSSLGRAMSDYVSKVSGGPFRASQRMGTSRIAASRLAGVLREVVNRGARHTLRELGLENLANRPIEEIFIGLTDYVCPPGGTVDEGIARDAFIETIIDLAGNGITDFDSLTEGQIQVVLEIYITHTIEKRLCNDIGAQIVTLPQDAREVANVQSQLHDFISRGVADGFEQVKASSELITIGMLQAFVDKIYECSFSILRALGEGLVA